MNWQRLRLVRLLATMLTLSVVAGCQLTQQTQPPAPIIEQNTLNTAQNTAVQTAAPTAPVIGRSGTYRVKPGDSLYVYVFDNPDLIQTVMVGPDGRFNFPLVGTVKAAGLTLNAIDAAITRRLSQNILQPEVTVTLNAVASRQIFVTGEVVAPGAFNITDPVSVVQAISMAGGFTAFADRSRIVVYNPARRSTSRRVFDFEAFLKNPIGRDFALHPGDIVIVE